MTTGRTAMRAAGGGIADGGGRMIDAELADAITRACEDRVGRPLAGGRELRFRCPAPGHDDHHPSARWHPDKQVWHCDACGAGGGAIDLARLLGLPLGPGVAPRAGSSWLGDVPTLSPTGGGVVPTPNPGRPGSLNHLKVISAHPSQGGEQLTDRGGERIVPSGPGRPLGRIVATYPYGAGRRVVRYEPKTFRPQHLAEGRWRTGRGPDSWPLYRQGELPDDRSVAVHVTEGEKDADALAGLGRCAVSPGSSATPWRPEWTGLLAGRPVVVHADHDPPGERRAAEIAGLLAPVAASVRVVPYRELPAGGDVSDFLATHEESALWARIAATAAWVVSGEPLPGAVPIPSRAGGGASPHPQPLPGSPACSPAEAASAHRCPGRGAVPSGEGSQPGAEADLPSLGAVAVEHRVSGESATGSRGGVGGGDLLGSPVRGGEQTLAPAAAPETLPEFPVAEFPLAVLPPAVRAYVERAAASLAVPPEMVAAPLLALAGSLAGNRLRLVLKAGFEVLPTLWVAVVAPPGSAKTPALGFARHGLEARQRVAYSRWECEEDSYESQVRAWSATREGDRGPEPRRPQLRHYWTANTTTEALAGTLTQAHGVAIIADELSGWIASMDQYRSGKGADRQTFLSLWSGVSTKIDRKSQPPVLIEQPVVGIAGGIQDDLVATLHDARQRRDGLIERFLFVRPQTEPGFWNEDDVPRELLAELERVFAAIDALPARAEATAAGPAGERPASVRFHPAARAVWQGWFDDNTEWVRESAGLERGFASKWPVQTARLALVLHLLWAASEGADPLRMMTVERLDSAIGLADWFRSQLGRVLPLFAPPVPDTAPLEWDRPAPLDTARERIVRLLRRHDGQWVSRSQLYQGLRTVPADRMQAELVGLEASGMIERAVEPSGARTRERWRLGPPPTE